MSTVDPYLQFANSALGRPVTKWLGLPRPVHLDRYTPGAPLLDGALVLAAPCLTPLLSAVLTLLAQAQVRVLSQGVTPVWIAAANQAGLLTGRFQASPGANIKALLFDASSLSHSAELEHLYEFFHATVRSLGRCGRIIILGRPPEACSTPAQAIVQRALEGLSRSLAKELGRGITSQLVYVAAGAEAAECGLEATLRFLLSPRSAYVSGQVIRISSRPTPAERAALDWNKPLTGQTALVTGAAQGIGAAIAEVLARDGAQLICVDIPQAAAPLDELCQRLGAQSLSLDIAAPEAPEQLHQTLQSMGGLDVLVHNAGITRDKTIANMAPERWRQVIDINVFFLGFGGSRWTSDMAINYYKTVLGLAAQLMAMVLLVAIGKEFINHYYTQISENMASQELAVMLVISVILLFLVNKVPPMISGLVSGGGIGAAGGIGNFGAGAAVGAAVTAASMATGGAALAGKAVMGAAAGAAGGASALQAAFQKASASMETGGDMSSMGSVVSSGGNGGGEAGTAGSSPFAQAAGFGDSGSSSSGGGFAKAAKLATGTASELAKGVGSQVKQGFQERVSETTGGKLAASIRESMEPKEASQSGQFEGNSLGADSGPDSNEVRS